VKGSINTKISIICTAGIFGALLSIFFFSFSYGSHDIMDNINLAGFGLIGGCLLGLLCTIGIDQPLSIEKTKYLFFTGIRLALAILIFKHAIDQVHGAEFSMSYYAKEDKLVNYSAKQFFWLFHAYNPLYQKVFGWILMTGAIGLCFRFTTLLSCFLLFPIFMHILIMDHMFDIGLKLDSTIILFSLLGILFYFKDRLMSFFLNEAITSRTRYPFFDPINKTYKSIILLKLILIVGYISLLNHDTFDQMNRWWRVDSPIIQGVWQIDTIQSNTDTIPRFEKFFFEKGRRGIATVENDTMSGFQYIIDTSYNQLEFWNFHVYRQLDFKGKYELITDDTLEYHGTNKKDSLYILLSRIPEYDYSKK